MTDLISVVVLSSVVLDPTGNNRVELDGVGLSVVCAVRGVFVRHGGIMACTFKVGLLLPPLKKEDTIMYRI